MTHLFAPLHSWCLLLSGILSLRSLHSTPNSNRLALDHNSSIQLAIKTSSGLDMFWFGELLNKIKVCRRPSVRAVRLQLTARAHARSEAPCIDKSTRCRRFCLARLRVASCLEKRAMGLSSPQHAVLPYKTAAGSGQLLLQSAHSPI